MTVTSPAPVRLSICIPTYNRAGHLANCLESVIAASTRSRMAFQVCVSDNCSTDETASVVAAAQQRLAITCHKNPINVGRPRNYLNVVDLAEGEFVWLIGDDDLVMPNAVEALSKLFDRHEESDFFYVNAFHLTAEYALSFPQPFQTTDLPAGMRAFSPWPADREMTFFEMIDPRISFDFLGGMFLSVFRRRLWAAHTSALGEAAFDDRGVFSNFDNTFPHVKIFAQAFSKSKAFFNASPLIVCLTGAREWAPMYKMVQSVRLVEALQVYRDNGLPLWRFLWCKNYALRTFIPDLVYMAIHRRSSGYAYIRPFRLAVRNCLYPNVYLSVVYYCLRKMKQLAIVAVRTSRKLVTVSRLAGGSPLR
jgi:glycosyltransferase involved in cell wall biosynthesis